MLSWRVSQILFIAAIAVFFILWLAVDIRWWLSILITLGFIFVASGIRAAILKIRLRKQAPFLKEDFERMKKNSSDPKNIQTVGQETWQIVADKKRLFESQRARNKRILAEASQHLMEKVCEVVEDEYWHHVYCTLLLFASRLANTLVTHIEPVKNAWGKGSVENAIRLLEVCVQPMVSMWGGSRSRSIYFVTPVERRQQLSQKEKRERRENLISNFLNIFGDYSEQKLKEFINMDIQWICEDSFSFLEADQKGLHTVVGKHVGARVYATLLISKAREACGMQGLPINWSAKKFPIKKDGDLKFLNEATHSYDAESTFPINPLLEAYASDMIETFEKLWRSNL